MHLIDCFIELIAYTRYFLFGLGQTQPSYDSIVEQYGRLLDRAERCAGEGGFAQRDCRLALFAVCAWIDEMILCSEWTERDTWQISQLQRTYFGTTNAGEEFFQLLGDLKPGEREVREVFEYCLALGFKGRYFHANDMPALAQVQRDTLTQLLAHPEVDLPADLFPEANRTASAGKKHRRLRLIYLAYLLLFLTPVAVFIGLFLAYRQILDQAVMKYFGPGF